VGYYDCAKDQLTSHSLAGSKAGTSSVDIAVAISEILAEKDGDEIVSLSSCPGRPLLINLQKHIITGSKMTATAMIHYFKPKMESIIDKGSKVSHEQLSM